MDKYIIIPDKHIWDEYKVGYERNGISSRLYDFMNGAREIKRIIDKIKPIGIIDVGDMFHKRRHDALSTKYASRFIRKILEDPKCVGIFNVGNHDQTDKQGKNDYVKPLLDMDGNVCCPSFKGFKFPLRHDFYVIPYTEKPDDFIDKVKKLYKKSSNLKILITHQDIKGMPYESIMANKGLEEDQMDYLFKKFDFIINGHHHIEKKIHYKGKLKGINTGILAPIDFKNNNITPHIYLLTIENKEFNLKRIPLKSMPHFISYDIDLTEGSKDLIIKDDKKICIKIKIKGDKYKIEKWKNKFEFNNKHLYKKIIQSVSWDAEQIEYDNVEVNRSGFSAKDIVSKWTLENEGSLDWMDYAMEKLEVNG